MSRGKGQRYRHIAAMRCFSFDALGYECIRVHFRVQDSFSIQDSHTIFGLKHPFIPYNLKVVEEVLGNYYVVGFRRRVLLFMVPL